jgi:hypothetical protein
VFKNTVLRNIFEPGRQEVTGNWRKLQREEELHNFYTSLDINKIVKSTWMRWSACVAHTGQKRNDTGFWWGNLKKRDHLQDLGIDGMIIF